MACVPCSQHHSTDIRSVVPQANPQISLNCHGRCSCRTPRARLCITDKVLQRLAGSTRHSPTPFPKQIVVHKPSHLFKDDLAGRQPQQPPQWNQLDLVINSFSLALLIFYEIKKKKHEAKWRAEGKDPFFQQVFTIRHLNTRSHYTGTVPTVDTPWSQALGGTEQRGVTNPTSLPQVA